MKKKLCIAMIVSLLLGLLIGFGSFSVSADVSGQYTYMVVGDTAIITDVDTSIRGDITVPSTLGEHSVTRIDAAAFKDCTALTSVVIPNSVTSIGGYAFAGCSGLTTVTIPAAVTSIDSAAFENCTKLAVVNFNAANCTTMGYYDSRYTMYHPVFPGCTALKTVNIGKTVKNIPAYAFYGCNGLVSIKIPNTVTSIGNHAFYGCGGLTSVTIGSGVTSMGEALFEGCTALKTVTIAKGVKSISPYAFYECTGLTKITIPDSVTNIGWSAFYGCTKLSNVAYGAKKAQREKMDIGIGNDPLTKATWQYTNCIGAVNHSYTNNCDKTCNVCKETRTIKHTYSYSCDKTCNVCGATRSITHKYTNACDTKCNVCGATRSITHSYKTTTTKATLTKSGSIVKKCSVCGKVASNTAIKYPKTFTLSATSYTYNGAVKKPTVTVKDSAGKTSSSSNYTVTYASGRKNAGTYTVKVTMKGNYTGTKTLTFKINPVSVSKCKLSLSATSYTYDGKVKKPTVTVKTASGTKLTTSSYTVTYVTGRKNVGTYKVTVKMKGNYTGTKALTFTIKPRAASINTLTPKSKALSVKLNRSLKQSTGYQVQYSTSKTFKTYSTKAITNYNTSTTTLSGLKAKTTYYVRVRTYKTVNGTKYYSNWSTAKYAKTK